MPVNLASSSYIEVLYFASALEIGRNDTVETLIYFGLWAAVIFFMMRFGCGVHIMGSHSHGSRRNESESLRWEAPEQDKDPVCGRMIRTKTAKSSVHDGSVFYFCSRECREIFEAAPELYTGEASSDQEAPLLEHSK
mgnify:CR=1 FL=1|jgi:YHS domain-containing protein